MTVRRRHRKPDLLLVIAVVVAIGVLVTSGAYAAEPPAPQRPDVSYPDRTPAPPAAEAAEPGQEPVAFGRLLGEARSVWARGMDILAQAADEGWTMPAGRRGELRLGLRLPVEEAAGRVPERHRGTRAGAELSDLDPPARTVFFMTIGARW